MCGRELFWRGLICRVKHTAFSAFVSASSRRPEPSAMKWQANGELAGSDLVALLARLNQSESEERALELQQWLGRNASDV